jgi:hypothetical protein
MPVLDARGRLFGRFNLVDVVAAVFVVLLVPMGYVAYRVFRIPPTAIATVTPNTIPPGPGRRLTLTGRNFRPYLVAFISKTGEPYSMLNRLPESLQASFLVETPTHVELGLQPVTPGTYDIHVYDESQEVAYMKAAFTVTDVPRATVDAAVRFIVPPEAVSLLREGDRDRWEENGTSLLTPEERATLGPVRPSKEPVTFNMTHGSTPGLALDALVHIPAKGRPLGGWTYKSDWIRTGETLIFETDRYRIYGVIGTVTELTAARSSAPAQGGK